MRDQIDAASAVMQTLLWFVVVMRELSSKTKVSIYQSVYDLPLAYQTAGHLDSPSDILRSSVIREELRVELLFLCIQRSQMIV